MELSPRLVAAAGQLGSSENGSRLGGPVRQGEGRFWLYPDVVFPTEAMLCLPVCFLRFCALEPRRPLVTGGVKDEYLGHETVGLGVYRAHE